MAITLGAVSLPGDLAWVDRYSWNPVSLNIDYSLTGALIVQSAVKQAGRPITLQGSDNRAWADRATLTALQSLQAAGATAALSVRGESFTVRIESLDAAPLWDWADDSDPVALTLKMIAV